MIELSAPPLLEARRSGIATNAAAETIGALTAKLSADIERIERNVERSSARPVSANGATLERAPHAIDRGAGARRGTRGNVAVENGSAELPHFHRVLSPTQDAAPQHPALSTQRSARSTQAGCIAGE